MSEPTEIDVLREEVASLASLRAKHAKAMTAIKEVLELHEPDGDYCGECSIHDFVMYPCDTVVAIRTALGEGEK